MSLETMLGLCGSSLFKLLTLPRDTPADLQWWHNLLAEPSLSGPIPGPSSVVNLGAYSDASSSTGITIIIGGKWHVWRLLLPGWKTDSQDISWVEVVGFELLVYATISILPDNSHMRLQGITRALLKGGGKGAVTIN